MFLLILKFQRNKNHVALALDQHGNALAGFGQFGAKLPDADAVGSTGFLSQPPNVNTIIVRKIASTGMLMWRIVYPPLTMIISQAVRDELVEPQVLQNQAIRRVQGQRMV